MASVTVPGTNGSTVSVSATYNNADNSQVAQQIAGLLALAASNSVLSVTALNGFPFPPPPVTTGGTVNELLLGSGQPGFIAVPSLGSTGYVVVDDSSDSFTLLGDSHTTVLGGSAS